MMEYITIGLIWVCFFVAGWCIISLIRNGKVFLIRKAILDEIDNSKQMVRWLNVAKEGKLSYDSGVHNWTIKLDDYEKELREKVFEDEN